MLKYNDLISKLTDEQKIRILTGVGDISGKDMKILGIPPVISGNMKDCQRDIFPHTTSISHAWDEGLWGSVASAKIAKMVGEGTNLAVAPGARVKVSPYRKEATEDPYLASALSGAYLNAATSAGVQACAAGYYVTESDVKWLDSEPNEAVVDQFLIEPYSKAAYLGGTSNKVTDMRIPNEAYKGICDHIRKAVVDSTEFFICDKVSDENTVDFINQGIICLKASENALSVALSRFKKLRTRFEQGKDVTLEQLEEEISECRAISVDSLNASLDKALDFIFKCNQKADPKAFTDEELDALALRATLEAAVLLKNEKDILPLSHGTKLGLIGGIAFSQDDDNGESENGLAMQCREALMCRGFKRVKAARGYHMTDYGYDDQDAMLLCQRADVSVIFLGAGYEAEKRISKTEKLTLPPNQLYLIDKLAKKGKKLVAVIMTEHAPDVEFARLFDAVLVVPHQVKFSAEAIVRILTGEFSPSGRLAYTLYAGSERGLHKGAVYLRRLGMKAGPFVGYRYYDTADMVVGYPFGHGLSYAKFSYSGLKYKNGTVSFTVKNIGDVKSATVPQIYVGAVDSPILRPKKELCGFVRLELSPNERKRVTIKIDDSTMSYGGVYTIFVGESVSDVRLKRKIKVEGPIPEADGERLSDYLQTSSNILEDNYTLEAKYKSMRKTVKNILFGVSTLALAISITIFNVTTNANEMFLGVIAGILALFSILFFIIEAVERGKAHSEERKRIAKANKAYFEKADQIPVLSTDAMFKDEFDAFKEELHAEVEVAEDDDTDYTKFIDDNFRIRNAVAEFNKFAIEHGYRMGRGVVETLMASFTTSRLIAINGLSSEEFNAFVRLISEYFNCVVAVDDASHPVEEDSSVFFGYDAQWDYTKMNILTALHAASNSHEKVQIAALDGINESNVHAWLDPFMKYARSPKKKNRILISDEYGKSYKYSIARNLWLIVNMAEGEKIDTLPEATLKCMSVVKINYSACPVAEDPMTAQGFSSFQADYMVLKENANYDITEDTWKKIDKLEGYAKEHSDYAIGNKLWLDLEKSMAMLLACEMELADATDAAVATRILPSIASALKDKLSKEDKTILQTVEFVFGDDNIQYSKAFLDSLNTARKEEVKNVEATETAADVETSENAVADEEVTAAEIEVTEETEATEETEVTEEADVTEESESAESAEEAETLENEELSENVEVQEDNE